MSRLPSTDVFRALCWAVAAVGLAACGSTPTAPATQASVPVETVAGGDAKASSAEATTTPLDAPAAAVAQPVDVPPRAAADFDRALNFMRAGNVTEAELELKQLAEAYPQLAAPHVNLGLLYRKSGKLDQAEAALETATARNGASAIAWNELGVTRRMRGRFKEAADAYEHALAADANFAPAHRNYGVLLDLYMGDPERALTELERYKELTGEDKPVSGWIAELRQRTGKVTPPAPQPQQSEEAAPADAAPPDTPPAPQSPGTGA